MTSSSIAAIKTMYVQAYEGPAGQKTWLCNHLKEAQLVAEAPEEAAWVEFYFEMQAEEETKPEGSLHSNEGAEEENDMDYMGRVPDVAWGLPISDEEVAADNRGIYTVLPLHSKKGKLYAVCGGGDEVLRLLRFNEEDMSLDEVQVFDGRDKLHSDSITKVAVSADGHFIGAASMDGTVSLYAVTHNADDTVCLHHTGTLTGPEKEIEDIAWAPKGSVILASSADKSAWVWHAERGFVSVFTGHNAKVTKCAFVEVSAAREIACVTGKLKLG